MRTALIGLLFAVGLAPQIPGSAQQSAVPVVQVAQGPVATPVAPPAPKIQVTFEPGGLVSLSASNASLRAILDEWTRKGGTTFNGADRLPASPMTVQYDHRPEVEVMNSLLRTTAGAVMALRDQVPTSGPSDLGVVFILATSTPTATAGYSTPAYSAPQPQFSTTGSPDQEVAPIAPGRGAEPPQPSAPPPGASRPSGVSPVAVQVVPVSSVPTAGATPTPTPTPTPTGPGRGGRGR